ncbi:MAG: hypothetical protein GX549_00830 [Clostridiales bacterium]|nr:hypothetical protein [Clostridiales bacterium]
MRFVILDGDERHEALARHARERGYTVFHFRQQERFESASLPEEKTVWALPILSLTRSGEGWNIRGFRDFPLTGLLIRLREGDMVVYADLTDEPGKVLAAAYPRIRFINLLSREHFVSENAILTAEGALCLAAGESRIAFRGSRCLVIGYGHIGKILSGYLQTLGAQVTASARKEKDLATIRIRGMNAVHTYELDSIAGRQDFLFNTVPARILSSDTIRLIGTGALIIDLASAPYCADEQMMEDAGRRYRRYPGIPGKLYPESAGHIIFDQIMLENQIPGGNGSNEVVK